MSENTEPKKPFFEKEVKCPVCDEPGVHLYLRDHTFNINKRESDYFVSEYTWSEPEYNVYSIHNFGIWHCQVCKFTDERKYFFKKNLSSGRAQYDYLRKMLIKLHDTGDPAFKVFRTNMEYPSHNLMDALTLMVFTIYVHTLPDELYHGDDKIARFYLRCAWLFRLAEEKPHLENIGEFLNEYDAKFNSVQANVMNSLGSIEELYQVVTNQNKNNGSSIDWQQQWSRLYPLLDMNYKDACSHIDSIFEVLKMYYEVGNSFKSYVEHADKSLIDQPFKTYDSYNDFLAELKAISEYIPTSSESAYKFAVKYFKKALNSKVYDSDSIKKFKVIELIIAISEHIKDYSTALKHCEMIENLTTRYYKLVTERLKRNEVIPDESIDPEHLKGLLRRNQEVQRSTKLIDKRIRPLKLKYDRVMAQQLLDQLHEMEMTEIRSKMQEAEIDESVILQFISTAEPEKKKSGIFDIFKR